ncbi:hypothetical protein CHS0354_006851 [Potamilus streckersoni]|uniref:Methionine--tRNA ligase, cytoplasmic n=1 Tax=Potamilus streckersoni TaxID=2493646 RepID=A0AAE0TE90_9BIVA|nr:hypothetical protein CHS0354_006851 [Potamilus streckersoni]
MEKITKSDKEWATLLEPEAYQVTRRAGTERAFTGKYHDYKGGGQFTCICCGHLLFEANTKFDSGTGWPSFWQPATSESVYEKPDYSLFRKRTEILCAKCDAHLGHSFPDGPKPTGIRYCINSASLNLTEDQVYCESCAKFLADRYVEGTCPHCNYNGARGDQCDKCGKLLQPQELLSPICAHCHNRPVRKPTSHLYIDLPKLSDKIAGFAKKAGASGNWTLNAVTTTEGWLRKGLEARPITRDLTWGVPVPHKGYESKVFYVWFDAPIGYVSQTKRHLPDRWEYWWKNPDGTELYQFMAKDNIPFHTVMFPAYQIASGEDWTMLHHISSTEYLNYEGTKFSKSLGIGVFGNNVR